MKNKKIKKIVHAELDELSELFDKISPEFEEKAIHDLRVAVKTIRSFLRLLDVHREDGEELKLPRKVKRLYHIAGTIRDAENESGKLAAKGLLFPVYTGHLTQIVAMQHAEWNRHYEKKLLHKFQSKLIAQEHPLLGEADLKEFMSIKMTAAETLSHISSPTNNQVHDIRKCIKDVMYIIKLSEKHRKNANKLVGDAVQEQLHYLADTIGDYNDARIMLDHIGAFQSKAMAPDEQKGMKTFYDKERAGLEKVKKKTLATIRKTLAEIKES